MSILRPAAASDSWGLSTIGTATQPNLREFLVALVTAFFLTFCLHADALLLPPTGDQAMGIWLEGICLERTNFDYYHVRFEEQTGIKGGPSAYNVSLLPTMIALLIKICPNSTTTFLVYRLATFFFSALGVASIYQMGRFVLSRTSAAGLALLCLTAPLMSAQTEILGMEIPMVGMTCVAILLLVVDRPALAFLAAIAAFFFKATGTIAEAGIGFSCGVLFLRRPSWRSFLTGAASVVVFMILSRIAFFAGMDDFVRPTRLRPTPRYIEVTIDPELYNLPASPFNGTTLPHVNPDLVLIAAFAAGLSVASLATILGRRLASMARKETPAGSACARGRWSPVVVMWTSSIAIVVPMFLFFTFFYLPRYATIMVPFVCLWFVLALHSIVGDGRILRMVLFAGVVFNLLNQEGRFFPSPESAALRPYAYRDSMYEGSLQYRRPLYAQMQVARLLEEKFAHDIVVTQWALGQQLALPELGLVSKPLHGYCFSLDTDLIPEFQDLIIFPETADPRKVIFASTQPTFDSPTDVLAIEEGDQTIMTSIDFPRLVVFRKPVENMRKFAARRRLTFRTVPIGMAKNLYQIGRTRNAQGYLEEALTFDPDCLEALLGLAYIALGQQDQEAIRRRTDAMLARNPDLLEPVAIRVSGLQSLNNDQAIVDVLIAAFRRLAPRRGASGWNLANLTLCTDDNRDAKELHEANQIFGAQFLGVSFKTANDGQPASFRRITEANAEVELDKLLAIAADSARKLLAKPDPSGKMAAQIVTLLTLVCELTANANPMYLDALATAHAIAKNFQEAARVQGIAVDQAVAKKLDARQQLAIRDRLIEYRRLAAAGDSSATNDR